MAEEIAQFVSKLKIDDEEDLVLDLDSINPNVENKLSLVLFGRLLTERAYNVDAFKRTITGVWSPPHGLVIRTLSPNLYAFQFFHWKDMAKVLEGRPWCFDNMLILLKEADGDEQPDQVLINHSPFWVRIKNLPFNYRSDEVVRALIGNMGDIIELEEDVLGIGRYRRVKVMLDITKPLRRFRKLKDKRGREFQVDFAYERLPFFCFACGIMGHSERNCHVVDEEEKQEKLGWSVELKATPRKGRQKEIEENEKFRASKKVLFPFEPTAAITAVGSPLAPTKAVLPAKKTAIAVENVVALEYVPCINGVGQQGDKTFVASIDVPGPTLINASILPTSAPGGTNLNPTNDQRHVFTFSSSKSEPTVPQKKSKKWKRIARGALEDKGDSECMDTDFDDTCNKRFSESAEMEPGDIVSGVKRTKLSSPHESCSMFEAEVGDDQPRRSL